jgi:hypothetical protein
MWQMLSSSIMTKYGSTTAVDRVFHATSIVRCQQIGLPYNASLFIYSLLQDMEFYLVMGYEAFVTSVKKFEDPSQPSGPTMLQRSSSTAPINKFNPLSSTLMLSNYLYFKATIYKFNPLSPTLMLSNYFHFKK